MMCGPFLSVQCFIAVYRCSHFRPVSHPVVFIIFSANTAEPASTSSGTAENTVSLNLFEAVNLVKCILRDQTIFPSKLRKGLSPADNLPALWHTCTCPVKVSLVNVVFLANFQFSKWEWVGRNFPRCKYYIVNFLVSPQNYFQLD